MASIVLLRVPDFGTIFGACAASCEIFCFRQNMLHLHLHMIVWIVPLLIHGDVWAGWAFSPRLQQHRSVVLASRRWSWKLGDVMPRPDAGPSDRVTTGNAAFLSGSTLTDSEDSIVHNVTTSSAAAALAAATTTTTAPPHVLELQQRAQQLRDEARELELALETTKLGRVAKTTAAIQEWMDKLFANSRPRTAQAVARSIIEERLTEEQILLLWQAMYRRRSVMTNVTSVSPSVSTSVSPSVSTSVSTSVAATGTTSQITWDSLASSNNATATTNQTELDLVSAHMQLLLNSAVILDEMQTGGKSTSTSDSSRRWSGGLSSKMRSQLKELYLSDQKHVQRQRSNMTVVKYMQQTLGLAAASVSSVASAYSTGTNRTNQVGSHLGQHEREGILPRWLPSSLLAHIIASNASLDAMDVRTIKERVLPKTRFYCTSSNTIPNAAIFRGNMRPGSSAPLLDAEGEREFSATVFTEIQQTMEHEGLAKRVQLFLLYDPEIITSHMDAKELRSHTVVVALPSSVSPDEGKLPQSLATSLTRVSSNVLAVATVLGFSASCYALNPTTFKAIVTNHNLRALSQCLPFSLGILAIQLGHEVAHRLVANRRGIRIGLPLLLPSFELGTFGCITPLMSYPPSRSALLDLALSGPLVSTALSLFLMVVGCLKTVYASDTALMQFPMVTGAWLKSSFLGGSILTFLLPKAMMMPLSQPIPVHPFYMVGYTQLMVSALNLLPIFCLDGGRACSAVVGPRLGALVSVWTLLSMLSFALSGSRVAYAWGLLVLLFQRRAEVALQDEVTTVEKVRTGVWISSLAVAMLSLLPFPKGTGSI